VRAGRVVSAAPDFALGLTFLATWIDPHRLGEKMISYLLLVMLLEFIIVHSSAFMGLVIVSEADRRKKTTAILGLAGLYTVFAGGFALAFKTWWPLGAFWLLTLNRLLTILLGQAPAGRERQLVTASWAARVLFYLMFVFATSFLPIPRLGITETVVRAERLPGSGLWIDEPQRVLAFGFLYFTVVALSELSGYTWATKMVDKQRDGGNGG
jgi:hypothetical protein